MQCMLSCLSPRFGWLYSIYSSIHARLSSLAPSSMAGCWPVDKLLVRTSVRPNLTIKSKKNWVPLLFAAILFPNFLIERIKQCSVFSSIIYVEQQISETNFDTKQWNNVYTSIFLVSLNLCKKGFFLFLWKILAARFQFPGRQRRTTYMAILLHARIEL